MNRHTERMERIKKLLARLESERQEKTRVESRIARLREQLVRETRPPKSDAE